MRNKTVKPPYGLIPLTDIHPPHDLIALENLNFKSTRGKPLVLLKFKSSRTIKSIESVDYPIKPEYSYLILNDITQATDHPLCILCNI